MNIHGNHRGMTLVEVLITLSIFIVLMGAITLFEYNIFSYPKNISGSYNTAQSSEALLRTMSKEMAMMMTGDNGSYALSFAGTSSVTFFSDVDSDGAVEQVRYYLSGTILNREVIEPSGSTVITYSSGNGSTNNILGDIRNGTTSVFTYYDGDYDGATSAMGQPVSAASVRLIKISLILDSDPNNAPSPRIYSTAVNLRNLKSNL